MLVAQDRGRGYYLHCDVRFGQTVEVIASNASDFGLIIEIIAHNADSFGQMVECIASNLDILVRL